MISENLVYIVIGIFLIFWFFGDQIRDFIKPKEQLDTKEHFASDGDAKFSDDLKYESKNHFLSAGSGYKVEPTGLKTKFDGVNAAVNILDKNGKNARGVTDFNMKYNQVVLNELG